MKLLTQANRKQLPKLYSQEEVEDPMVYVKFFNPCGQGTWFVTEFDGKDIFFGYCVIQEAELGYFSLSELKSIRLKWGLGIERDMHFKPKKLSEVKKQIAEYRYTVD